MPTAIEPLITPLIALTSGEKASFRIYGTVYENVKIVDITSDNVTIQLENGDLEAYAPSDMELEYKQPDLSNLPPPLHLPHPIRLKKYWFIVCPLVRNTESAISKKTDWAFKREVG